MVKADVKRDYYADLELRPSADEKEIKKQFRNLALKYHPDRNPGRELEFNAKFQAIQAANEILSDPAQRAKYDADRIKAASYNPFTSPTSTTSNVPQRNPYPNWPPPPRRAPPPATSKPAFPASPPTGNRNESYKYASFDPEDPSSNDDNQAKTNARKAWAQMRPPPQTGSFGKSTRHARANSFQTQNNSDIPTDSTPRPKSGYEYFQEKSHGFPGMSRANTMRVPKKAGFAPGTPGGDEPAAKNTSSYFNSRAERTAPRPQAHYPPPPPGPAPNLRRPNPLRSDAVKPDSSRTDPVKSASPRHDPLYPKTPRSFTSPNGSGDLFGSIDRLSTPYATSGGERTYFSSAGLNRSSSSHSNSDRNGWPKGYTPTNGSPLSPHGPNRHHSASPKMRSPKPRRDSFSSSSSFSSEDEGPLSDKSRSRTSARRASADHRSNNQGPQDGHRRPPYPSVRVEDGNELKADGTQPKHTSTWNSQPNTATQPLPKQYSASQPNSRKGSASSDQEGFFQHRAKWATDRGQQMPKSPLRATAPWNYQTFEKPLEKSRSWHENFGSKEEGNNQRRFDPPSPGQSKESRPMYVSSEYNFPTSPFLSEDSYEHLSSSPRSKMYSTFWPYWAVPSSITPKKRLWSGSSSFCWSGDTPFSTYYDANVSSLDSFQFPDDHSTTTSPRKTQSTENINTTFSPSGWHGKFNGDAEDYLGVKSNGKTPRGRSSPTKVRPNVYTPFRERPRPTESKENMPPHDSTKMPPPPPVAPLPPKSPEKVQFSEEQWRETFKDPNWVYPGPPPVQSPRVGNMKRPKPPRKMSTANKRPTVLKSANIAATIDREDEGDASNEASSVLESEASHSSSGNAMDIDPALTPPSTTDHFSPTGTHGQTYIDPITRIIRSAVPPQSQVNGDTNEDASRLNLSDLKKAAPFAPSQSGLKDLDDLKSTLPFPSAPSAIPGQSSAPQQLALPAPPRAPNVPETVTQSTFDQYMAYMHAYMAEWSMYNTKMLTHFNTRQNEVENELGNDWMSSIGMQGYAKYMRGVEEDFRVRKHWDVSWEKHREAMKALGKVREKAVKANCSA